MLLQADPTVLAALGGVRRRVLIAICRRCRPTTRTSIAACHRARSATPDWFDRSGTGADRQRGSVFVAAQDGTAGTPSPTLAEHEAACRRAGRLTALPRVRGREPLGRHRPMPAPKKGGKVRSSACRSRSAPAATTTTDAPHAIISSMDPVGPRPAPRNRFHRDNAGRSRRPRGAARCDPAAARTLDRGVLGRCRQRLRCMRRSRRSAERVLAVTGVSGCWRRASCGTQDPRNVSGEPPAGGTEELADPRRREPREPLFFCKKAVRQARGAGGDRTVGCDRRRHEPRRHQRHPARHGRGAGTRRREPAARGGVAQSRHPQPVAGRRFADLGQTRNALLIVAYPVRQPVDDAKLRQVGRRGGLAGSECGAPVRHHGDVARVELPADWLAKLGDEASGTAWRRHCTPPGSGTRRSTSGLPAGRIPPQRHHRHRVASSRARRDERGVLRSRAAPRRCRRTHRPRHDRFDMRAG